MTIWRWTALFGVAVVIVIFSFGAIDGIKACGTGNPIFKFEMVKTPADVAVLFPGPCRAAHVAAQAKGLRLDNIVFIPVYSGFLILALLGLRRGGTVTMQKLVFTGIVLVALAAFNDWMENAYLDRILQHMPGTQEVIDKLFPWPRTKFFLLGAVVAMTGWLHFRQAEIWRRALGALALFGGTLSAAGIVFSHDWVSPANMLGWAALIVTAMVLAFKKADTSPSA